MKRKREKKAQITLIIIVAIVVIAIIAVFFLLQREVGKEKLKPKKIFSENYIEECIRKHLEEGVQLISLQGGFLDPDPSISFSLISDGLAINVPILCSTRLSHTPCEIIEGAAPLYDTANKSILLYMTNDITQNRINRVEECIESGKENAKLKYDSVRGCDNKDYEVKISEGGIFFEVKCDEPLKMERGEIKKQYDSFKINYDFPLYYFIDSAEDIIGNLTENCNNNEYTGNAERKILQSPNCPNCNLYEIEKNNFKFYFIVKNNCLI